MRVAKSTGTDSYMQQMAPQRRTSAGYSSFAIFGGPIIKEDLLFGALREPAAHRITFDVAHDVFDKWFKLENLDDENDTDLDTEVQKALETLNAKSVLTQVLVMERIYGWAVLGYQLADSALDLSKPADYVSQIERLQTLYDGNISQVTEDRDPQSSNFGLPEYVQVNLALGGKQLVHRSRFFWLATRLTTHVFYGESSLESIMDDLTVLRNMRWGFGMTMIRYGSGFPDVKLNGAKTKDIDNFIESGQFDNLSAMKYFVHNEDQELNFKGMGTAVLDPGKYVEPILESISLGSGIPVAILRGAQAGALTGSEVNEREYFRLVSDVQGRVEPMVRDLINKILPLTYEGSKIPEYKVNWNSLYEQSEREGLACALEKERIIQLKLNYMMVNEVRKVELGDSKNVSGGDVILSILKGQTQGPGLAAPAGDSAGADEEAVANLQNTLTKRLSGLVAAVKESKMTKDEALLAAEITVEEHVQSMKKIAKLNLEQKLNMPIGELSPENQMQFIALKKGLMDDFKRILNDAVP